MVQGQVAEHKASDQDMKVLLVNLVKDSVRRSMHYSYMSVVLWEVNKSFSIIKTQFEIHP